jgi:hypothetical protein
MNKGVPDYPRSSRRPDHCPPCVRTTVHYLSCGDFVKTEMLDLLITDSAGVSDWLPVPYLVDSSYAGIPGGIPDFLHRVSLFPASSFNVQSG